jgi:hypothetical protein
VARRKGSGLNRRSGDGEAQGIADNNNERDSSTPSLPSTSTIASWRDHLAVHPAAELFPPLPPDELRTLGEDIIKNGLTSPIALWRADPKVQEQLLDGRNRLDAIELVTGKPVEIGAPSLIAGEDFLACDKVIVLDKSVDPYAYAISANIHRRHLTGEQKRDLIGKLLKATPEKSNRQIAETVKADDKTVGAVRRELEATAEIPQLTKTVGKDRKARPSKRKRPPTEEMAASKAAVPIPLPTETVVREAVAPDEELALLREFARFVINRARVSTDPKDHIEWKVLLDRVEQVGSLKKEKDHD